MAVLHTYCTNDASFGAHHEKKLKKIHTVSSQNLAHLPHFRSQRVRFMPIFVWALWRGPQTIVGWSEPAIF